MSVGPAKPADLSTLPVAMRAWLRKWRRRKTVAGRCFEASLEGMTLFPQLRPVVGATAASPSRAITDFQGVVHCWLMTPKNTVVDPTAHQYRMGETGLEHWPFLVQPVSVEKLFSNKLWILMYLELGYPPDPRQNADGVRTWLHNAVGWPIPETAPPR